MVESGRGGRKWVAYGCFGCLGIAGVAIALAAGTLGLAFLKVRSEQLEERVITRDVPSPREGEALTPDGTEARPGTSSGALRPEAPGRVVLHVSQAELEVERFPHGSTLRVEATYDGASYELDEELVDSEDREWEYRVRFRQTSSSFLTGLKELLGGTRPKVRVRLPSDVPMSLEAEVSQGEATADLGGLWLTSADLDFSMGGFELRFGEPPPAPMERLSIRGSMGGFDVSALANASPRSVEIDCSMGGMQLDLRGRWTQDSDIRISHRMGGGVVFLPENVQVRGLAQVRPALPGQEREVEPPTLTFTVSSEMGDLEFVGPGRPAAAGGQETP